MTKAEQIGRNNALEAIDQAGSFRDLAQAIDSYYCNLAETVSQTDWNDADRGFMAVLASNNISHIPTI